MVDRITRKFAMYPTFRQSFSNQLESYRMYEQRNPSMTFSNGHAIGTAQYPRMALEYSINHAIEEANRIHYMYSAMGAKFTASEIDPQGLPYQGQNVDMMA